AFLSSTLTVQSSSPEQFQKPAFDHGIAFDRPAALRGAYSTQNPTGPGVKRPAHFYISTRAFSTSGLMEIAGSFRPLQRGHHRGRRRGRLGSTSRMHGHDRNSTDQLEGY